VVVVTTPATTAAAAARARAVGAAKTAIAPAAAVTTTAAAVATAVIAAVAITAAATAITATALAAITAATTTKTAARAAWRAGFHGAGLVDDQSASAQGFAVHAGNGGLRLGIVAHLDKAKTFGASSIALHHDFGTDHCSELAEFTLQIVVSHAVGKIAYVKLIAH